MPDDAEAPLPSAPAAEDDEDDGEETPEPERPSPRPPAPQFKLRPMTSLYLFLGFLGIWMLFDLQARNEIAGYLGTSSQVGPLYVLIGFGSSYLLLTMALAGAVEMFVTAAAYNFTTDWMKAAKVQSWSAAFRKVQMAALRSGKKDRLEALKPHQQTLAKLSSEVSIAQFKGMAITYFLLILIYTWVGIVIGQASAAQQTIALGGASIHLTQHVGALPVPWWFLIFSLYTVPLSLVFRRVLKHLWLRRYAREHPPVSSLVADATGGAA